MKSEIISELRYEFERAFVRGEIAALQWVATMRSVSISERIHIVQRIKILQKFLAGEIKADCDGTVQRPVPDFQEGEK